MDSSQEFSHEPSPGEEKKSRRPANTAFRQQRLKAWQPILTPKNVIWIFFVLGIFAAIVGGLLLYASRMVSDAVPFFKQRDETAFGEYRMNAMLTRCLRHRCPRSNWTIRTAEQRPLRVMNHALCRRVLSRHTGDTRISVLPARTICGKRPKMSPLPTITSMCPASQIALCSSG